MKDFFRIYYAPNNAVLTLVGDFDPDEALAKVKKYFGAIPAQPAPPKVDLNEEPHYGERREDDLRSAGAFAGDRYGVSHSSGQHAGKLRGAAADDVLGQGESSRFYQRLVKEKQLASAVNVQADTRIGTSQLYISANPRPGVKVEDLEKAIDEEIATVVKSGITPEELAKAKSQLLRQFIERRRSALFTAILIGNYTVYFNDPNLINTIVDKEHAVTLEEVNAAAKKYLVRDQRAVVITYPAADEKASSKGAQ